jgi:peptidoglycan hydrolase-like protein with peptidoglycan-binding domain
MFYKLKNIAIIILLTIIIYTPILALGQGDDSYSLPFSSNSKWRTNDYQGVHTTALGYGIDLFPTNNKDIDILAPSDGKLSRVCTVGEITTLRLLTNKNDIMQLAYLANNSVPVKEDKEIIVRKGDKIGTLGKEGIHKSSKCDLSFPEQHLQLSWEKKNCDFKIQEYTFNCDGMKKCNEFAMCNFKNINQDFESNINSNNLNYSCGDLIKEQYEIGNTGTKIVKLQQCLKDMGYFNYIYGITGYYGNYTASQLKKLNSTDQYKKPADNKKPKESCDSILTLYYREEQKDELVRQLQECLRQKNYYNYPAGVTGYYGEYTKSSYNNYLNSANNICELLKIATYNQGENSSRVKRLQQCLRSNKLFDFPMNTGYFGPITQLSLTKWKL